MDVDRPEAVPAEDTTDEEPTRLPVSPAAATPRALEEKRARPQAAQRAISRGRRFTKGEIQLILEIYSEHRGEKWARMTEIYNAVAEQRGWVAGTSVVAFRTKCVSLVREMGFRGKTHKDPAVMVCRRWERVEDEALAAWDRRVAFKTQYAAFITWMRESLDVNYFRTTRAIADRLRFLARRKRKRGESATLSDTTHGSDETETDEESAEYYGLTPRHTERSISPQYKYIAQVAASPPEAKAPGSATFTTGEGYDGSLREGGSNERSTAPDWNRAARVDASSPVKTIDKASSTAEDARCNACDPAPLAVPESFAPTPLGLLATKLRDIQTVRELMLGHSLR